MSASQNGHGPTTPPQPDHPASDPGESIPKRPQDSRASGDARNDTGEDNQGAQGDRPAEDYIRP